MLRIKNLQVKIKKTIILNKLNLTIKPKETHVIMGNNGSGKSTLAKVISGDPIYKITNGTILFQDKNLIELKPEQRSLLGLFLGFQHPIVLPGVNNFDFLQLIYNTHNQNHNNNHKINPLSFIKILNKYLQIVKLDNQFLHRNVNENFSGGEQKKNEMLQMLLINPKLSILDEIDSGLDIDAFYNIVKILLTIKKQNQSMLIITHSTKLVENIKPDYIHLMNKGNIVQTGTIEINNQLIKYGYKYFF
uniref:SufC n=1 Tax=Pterocladiophila hemisphaerica TaxID=2712948 RepID=A0A6M3WX61_9FLOR|nr:sufC [Pterocladiophila hemisphaerica]